MKKFLLSIMSVALCAGIATATEVTLDVNAATDIKGTDVPERPAGTQGDKDNGQGRHIQPLESLKIGDYSFTFGKQQVEGKVTDPAYYYPMSTNTKGSCNIRVYNNNTMTITAPAGKEFASIVSYKGTAKTVIYSGEKVSTYTYNATSTVQMEKLVLSDEKQGEDPNPPVEGTITVKKATTFAPGAVAFVFNEGFVETFEYNATKPYGYWMAVAATPADEMKVTEKAIFTIASTDKGYTIKDCQGYFMGWDGEHWSFNAYTSSDEGNCYWDITMVDGKVKIANKVKSSAGNEVYLAGKTYNSDYEMCPTDRTGNPLPMLYVKSGTGVENIAIENEAAPVYYNLQGVRVANPENGIFIVVKGGKSQKVMF